MSRRRVKFTVEVERTIDLGEEINPIRLNNEIINLQGQLDSLRLYQYEPYETSVPVIVKAVQMPTEPIVLWEKS
jgi:hypothetical protein